MRTTLLSLLLLALLSFASTAQADEVELLDLGNGVQGNAYFSPYEELDKKVLEILDKAEPGSTVYQSYYSLSYTPYFWKYGDLTKKGVDVKVNLWSGSYNDSTDSRLKKAGVDNAWILNIRRPPPEAWSSMHTKITVVNEEWVISGSANLSNSASLANHEHIIVLRNPELAREFIKEFEEQRAADAIMREYEGEIDGESDPDYAEMMDRLADVDVKTVNDSSTVKTYFSPDDEPQWRMVELIDNAQESIKIAMYTFFAPRIAMALEQAADRGVKVVALLDAHQHEHNQFAEYTLKYLRDHDNIQVVMPDTKTFGMQLGNYASLHHKYAIIDDETVVGGSYNWTGTAHRANDENTMVIKSKVLADRFNTDFASILERYEPETLTALRADGMLPEKAQEGHATRVLFAVSYNGTDENGNNAWDYDTNEELVVVGNVPELGDGDPAKGLVLRGSRSVSPNLLGSVDLPRGAELEWRIVVRKKKGNAAGVTTILQGNTVTNADPKNQIETSARDLTVDMSGTPMIVGPLRPESLKSSGTVDWSAPTIHSWASPQPSAPATGAFTFPGAGQLGGGNN